MQSFDISKCPQTSCTLNQYTFFLNWLWIEGKIHILIVASLNQYNLNEKYEYIEQKWEKNKNKKSDQK